MLKKMTVLAMAVGVLAALALPASVSASWKHHNTALQQNVTLALTGQARFEGEQGGVECQITSSVQFKAGQTTGTAHTFKPDNGTDTEKCKGLGGLAPCQIHNLNPQEPNWVFHTITGPLGEAKIQVTTTDITSQTTGGFFCFVKAINLTAPTGANFVTLKPNQANTVTSAQIEGNLQADIQTNGGAVHKQAVTVSGLLQFEKASESNTYSI